MTSSRALQAHAKGEAAAGLKTAELQKKVNELQSKSAMALELQEKKRREDDIAFARRKLEEQARLESLRAEQEAAVAVARAKAIDQELRLVHEYEPPDLPFEEPGKRVDEFFSSQLGQLTQQDQPRGPDVKINLVVQRHKDKQLLPLLTRKERTDPT